MKLRTLEELVSSLERKGIIKTPEIKEAFLKVDRANFILPEHMNKAYWDAPLLLWSGQTNSQPLTVAYMLELLQPEKGDKVLDIGSGSGWTTALIAEIVGKDGYVYGIERVESLKEFGEENVKKMSYKNVKFKTGDGTKGWEKYSPFDKILVSAASQNIPDSLIEQLRVGGNMVIPLSDVMGNMVRVTKLDEERIEKEMHPGFSFVPLVTD